MWEPLQYYACGASHRSADDFAGRLEASGANAAAAERGRLALRRLVAQGACPRRLRLPLLAAGIPLLDARPPVLQHAELHALLAALEVLIPFISRSFFTNLPVITSTLNSTKIGRGRDMHVHSTSGGRGGGNAPVFLLLLKCFTSYRVVVALGNSKN